MDNFCSFQNTSSITVLKIGRTNVLSAVFKTLPILRAKINMKNYVKNALKRLKIVESCKKGCYIQLPRTKN